MQASLLEGRVLEQVSNAPQGSGIGAIQLSIDAGNQGIPLYSLTAANASTSMALVLLQRFVCEGAPVEVINAPIGSLDAG